MGVKTYTNDDTFSVANTLVVDVPTVVGYIVAFKGPTIDEICICDNLAWFFPIDFKVTQGGRCGQPG